MNDLLTLFEYQTASTELRRQATALLNAEKARIAEALAELKTEQGQLEAKRRAQAEAARALANARMADLIARKAELDRQSPESQELGKARLEAASAEAATWTDPRWRARQ